MKNCDFCGFEFETTACVIKLLQNPQEQEKIHEWGFFQEDIEQGIFVLVEKKLCKFCEFEQYHTVERLWTESPENEGTPFYIPIYLIEFLRETNEEYAPDYGKTLHSRRKIIYDYLALDEVEQIDKDDFDLLSEEILRLRQIENEEIENAESTKNSEIQEARRSPEYQGLIAKFQHNDADELLFKEIETNFIEKLSIMMPNKKTRERFLRKWGCFEDIGDEIANYWGDYVEYLPETERLVLKRVNRKFCNYYGERICPEQILKKSTDEFIEEMFVWAKKHFISPSQIDIFWTTYDPNHPYNGDYSFLGWGENVAQKMEFITESAKKKLKILLNSRIKCNYCSSTYKSLGSLRSHMIKLHPDCEEIKIVPMIEDLKKKQEKLYMNY